MKSPRFLATSIASLVPALTLLSLMPAAQATDLIKLNNNTALNLSGSWSPAQVPTSADRLVFDATNTATNAASLGGSFSILGIQVTSGFTLGFTINNTAGAVLTIGTSGIDMSGAASNFTTNNATALGTSQIFDINTGRTLLLQGSSGASLNLGSNVLTVQGAGTTSLNSLIYGSGSITKAGTGTLNLNFAAGSANSTGSGNLFSGGLTVGTGGTVAIAAVNNSGTGLITSSGTLNISAAQLLLSGGITVSAGTTTLSSANSGGTGAITVNGGSLVVSNATAVQNNTVTLSGGTLTPAATMTFGALSGSTGFTASAGTLTLGANNATATYSGNIAGAVASNLVKTGSGTQILNGTNATTGTITANGSGGTLEIGGQWNANTGAVSVNAGALKLNFNTGATTTNLLNSAATLTLGGGKLTVQGKDSATDSLQSLTGLTTTAGTASTVSVVNGNSTGVAALNIGALTSRGAGSTVNFVLPTGTQTATNGILTSAGSAGALLRSSNNHAFATVNGTDFAAKDATTANIVALSGSVTATSGSLGASGDNSDINGVDPTVGAGTINTLRFNDSAARTLTLSGALNVNSGGILVSGAVTTAGSKISGSTITAGATPSELIIHQFSNQAFTLDSQITGAIGLVKTGPGTLILTKANTNSATSYVSSGTLQIGTGGSLGSSTVSLAPNDPTAVFNVNNQSTSVLGLAGGGTTGGYVNLGASGILNINGTATNPQFVGSMVGGVDSIINKAGTALQVQGFNTSSNVAFYGTLNVNGGQVGFFTNAASFINANVVIGASGTVQPGTGASTTSIGDLSGSGAIIGASGASTAQTYQFGYLGGTKSFSGIISNGTNVTPGLTGIIKYGSGTTAFSGANSYSGPTQLNSGGLIFDYSTGNTPLSASSALTVGGATATFKGLAAGGTTATTGTFGVNNSVLSTVALDSNGAAGGITVNSKTAVINGVNTLGSSSVSNILLFDTSTSANNVLRTDLAIGAATTSTSDTIGIRTNNGLLTTGVGNAGITGYRANVLIKDATGIGFATTSGTSIVRYTGATTLTAANTTTVLAEDGTGNYKLSTNLTRGASNQFFYNTLELDSSSQAVTLTTDSNGNRFGSGSASTSGRGVLATGTNGATITSPGGTNQSTYFYNYQTGTTAGQTLTLNMSLAGTTYFNGTGPIVATGVVQTSDQWFQSGVTRLTGAQSSGDALTAGAGVYRLVGGVLEIGADLTGSISSTSSADFSRSVGSSAGQIQLLGDTGFSAFGGTRTVNLGGAGRTLLWGNDNFLASPAGATTEGNNTFKLSSAFSDATIDFQNGIALGSTTRTVEVANGSAATDAKLSGVISGVLPLTTTLGNSAPALTYAAAGLTKTGAGTLELSAANTYTGPTRVTAGTLEISGSLSATTTLNVPSGTLLLSGNNAVNSTSNATSLGTTGVLAQSGSGKTDLLGALTLSAGSTLDFGAGNSNTLTFASLDLANFGGLKVMGWTGVQYTPDQLDAGGGTQDRLLFNSTTGLSDAQLSGINFFDDGGTPIGSGAAQISFGSQFELVPIPEPSSSGLLGSAVLLGFIGFRQRRRLFGKGHS